MNQNRMKARASRAEGNWEAMDYKVVDPIRIEAHATASAAQRASAAKRPHKAAFLSGMTTDLRNR